MREREDREWQNPLNPDYMIEKGYNICLSKHVTLQFCLNTGTVNFFDYISF